MVAKGLTRATLTEAALRIVDGDGLVALSMRRLGSELRVDPMAAYRHIPNKEALLDEVVEAVMSEIDPDAVDAYGPLPDRFAGLPPHEFPLLGQAAHAGALSDGLADVLDFAVDGMIAALEAKGAAANDRLTGAR